MANETDNLLDDVRAAAAQLERGDDVRADVSDTRDVARDDAPAEKSGDQDRERTAAERARDEQGRFAKAEEGKPRETLKLKETPAEHRVEVKPDAPAPITGSQPDPVSDRPAPIAAPVEWKGSAKVKWDRLPREVQAEIVERHTAAEQRAAQYAPLEQAITPYREAWVRDAGSVEAAIGQLGQFYRLYLDNPAGLIQHIAATRGINLGSPQGQPAPQGGAPQPAPDIASIVKQVVEQQIAPIQQRFAQDENQQLNDTISAFAADPKHPFFQDVKVHMGQLLSAGTAKNLGEAYEQATWANPAIRAHLLAAQSEEAGKARAAEVEKAKKANAASLRGSPLPGGGNAAAANGSASVLDDTRAAAAEVWTGA